MPSNAAATSPVPATPVRRVRRTRNPVNDLDLQRWKEYEEIWTDSLWMIDERDSSGAHRGDYHGNFVPQIPRQMMLRYTRKGDVVCDPFAGSGTTLIEAQRLGRHALGLELSPSTCELTRKRLREEPNTEGVQLKLACEDSCSGRARLRVLNWLKGMDREHVQLLVLHPPYHDIIQFSESENCLSNASSTEDFLAKFGAILDNLAPFLEKGRYLALVIGDKYSAGEWIPLGFLTMQEVMNRGFALKSLVVKNMTANRAKRNLQQLWRYRALTGGFYIFRHEYVLIFRKR